MKILIFVVIILLSQFFVHPLTRKKQIGQHKNRICLKNSLESLNYLKQQKQEILDSLNKLEEKKASIITQLVSEIREEIKKGVLVGNRWKLSEEGDFLVFRDATSGAAGNDKRYAMVKEKSKDL